MAKKPLYTKAEYRKMIPLYKEHRNDNAPNAVIASADTPASDAFLDEVLQSIDVAAIKDMESTEANAQRDELEIRADDYFTRYDRWTLAEHGPNSPASQSLPKRPHS